jgi:WD40 repeat protein
MKQAVILSGLLVWSANCNADYQPLARIAVPSPIWQARFSPSGKTLAICGNATDGRGMVKLLKPSSLKLNRELFGRVSASIRSLSFAPSGKALASIDYDGHVVGWDHETGIKNYEFKASAKAFEIWYVSETQLAIRDVGKSPVLWDIANPLKPQPAKDQVDLGNDASICEFSSDGLIVAMGFGHIFSNKGFAVGGIEVRNATNGKVVNKLRGPEADIRCLAFSADHGLLAAGYEVSLQGQEAGAVIVWDLRTGMRVCEFGNHDRAVTALAFSPNSKNLASASYDGTLNLWNLKDKRPLVSFKASNDAVFTVAFSPDGSLLATGGLEEEFRVWRVKGLLPKKQKPLNRSSMPHGWVILLPLVNPSQIVAGTHVAFIDFQRLQIS